MREPATYQPGGAGHRVLRVLGQAPATRDEIYLGSLSRNANGHKRLSFVLTQILADGFAVRQDTLYALTDLGREVLAELNAGFNVQGSAPIAAGKRAERDRDGPQPTVRVFGRVA